MYKNVICFVIITLMLAINNNAQAAYENSHLNLAVYNTSLDIEILYDLGTIGTDFDLSDQSVLLETGVNLTDMANVNAWAKSVLGETGMYFGTDHIFATVPMTSEPGTTGLAAEAQFSSAASNIMGQWSSDPVNWGEGAQHATSAPNSYVDTMKAGSNYAGWNLAYPDDGPILIDSIAADGYVDMTLWYYAPNLTTFQVEVLDTATLRLDASGNVILNPVAAVPVPAAAWLLGSGILSLAGLRYRFRG